MKSVTAVCASSLSGVSTGRVHRQRRDVENEEIQMYLSKLKELVPRIPKNRRLSKLEVIQHVIDYIGDLQHALETHPAVVGGHGATAMTPTSLAARSSTTNGASGNLSPRQPLGTLAPNAIPPTNTSCATQEQITTPPHLEKVIPSDSRPVSC